MNEDLNILAVQLNIEWKNIATNKRKIEKLIQLHNDADIVVLPEMFNTGFLPNVENMAETMNGDTVKWMSKVAVDKNIVLTGSLIIKENNKFYNRLIWATPDKRIQFYDKRHLFSYSKENENFTHGTQRVVFAYKGWRILPQICYDLRFPVWSRNQNDYDIALYVASWPKERTWIWEHLLISRAIENQVFIIGINRVGTDGNDLIYEGKSQIIAPTGIIISQAIDNSEQTLKATLSHKQLQQWQNEFPAINDRDNFELIV